MKHLFLTVVGISISTSVIILVMLLFSACLNRRYAAKYKYLIWIVIAVRLIVPFPFRLPVQKLVIDVPAQITAPINGTVETEIPLVWQEKPKIRKITLLDIAAWLWLMGCLLLLSVHIVSFWHFKRRMLRDGEAVADETVLHHICRLSGELSIKSSISVVRCLDAGSPMMIGFFKPVLVLPDCEYSEEELFFILKHELIHFKQHDIYFKLLFVAAHAVHWFNPLVYMMQKEAVTDMELACDERVIWQMPYAVRKAYTETLFSTLSRQYQKETAFTTQFYGGKRVMKKRFQNILTSSKKKNGVMVSVSAICFTVVSGMLVGCSAADTAPFGMQTQAQFEMENTVMQTENRQGTLAIADRENGPENITQNTNREEQPEAVLADDREEMQQVVEAFAAAYFGGDINTLKGLLSPSFAWDIEAYEGTGTISDVTVKGLPEAGEQADGSVCTVSVQYRDSTYADMFQYVTLELKKQSTGWEIQFYGVEG